MPDHHFSKRVCEAFEELGDWDFTNLIEHQPWSTRSRTIAKQRIFEKYILPEDVFQAVILQRHARNTGNYQTPYYWGRRYLKETLDKRSNSQWNKEQSDIMETLPTIMDYAKDFYGITEQDLIDVQKPNLTIVK